VPDCNAVEDEIKKSRLVRRLLGGCWRFFYFYYYLPVYFYCSGFWVELLLWVLLLHLGCSSINIAVIVPVRRHLMAGLTECAQTGKKCDAVHEKMAIVLTGVRPVWIAGPGQRRRL